MIAVKGRYDGTTVTLDRAPAIHDCDVIVTFLDASASEKSVDDGSLAYLFKDFTDDGLREPLVSFGKATGNEQW